MAMRIHQLLCCVKYYNVMSLLTVEDLKLPAKVLCHAAALKMQLPNLPHTYSLIVVVERKQHSASLIPLWLTYKITHIRTLQLLMCTSFLSV